MTPRLRFDGRVAVVTGGGRGIGRAHALLLASRGAAVVVNDSGVSVAGRPLDENPAEEVVTEIRASGGQALASRASVDDKDGAAAIVADAVREFGRLDIVVNNAGITAPRPFPELAQADREIAVHYLGTFFVCQAAWPHLAAAGYGRIVNTTSSTVFGMPGYASYGSAKGAVLAFTKNLATEALTHGIRVNAIAPSAATRMLTEGGGAGKTPELIAVQQATRPVELVPPAMAYLAHESCRLNGEVLSVGGGKVSRYFLAETKGWRGGPGLAPEDLAEHLDEILDPAGADAWTDVHASVQARLAAREADVTY
jgi:NAD(P)-dependent dehydrogenase (short-subunit alcohol dehydrogenase family)